MRQDAIVLADLEISGMVPIFGGKVIALPQPVFLIADHEQRRADLKHFFKGETPTIERRELIDRYSVEYVFLSLRKIPRSATYMTLGKPIVATEQFVFIAVSPLEDPFK